MRRFWLVLLAAGIVFSACEKLNLKRDNPLDRNNPDYVGDVDNPDKPGAPDEPDAPGDDLGTGALIQYDSCKVSYDGNGDGIINKGEYVRLDVSLKNSGTSNAYGVKAVFSTESVYASDFESGEFGVVEYDAISAGATKWSGVFGKAFGFTVSKEALSGTTIPIKIAIEDAQGNQWEDSLSLMVEGTGALIQYDGYKVSYDGNGDGVINKGEYVRLDVSLKNSGTSNAYGVKAIFSTESVYASDFESGEFGVVEYDAISAGATKWSGVFGKAFGFTVSKDVSSGTTIPIDIAIEDAHGNKWNDCLSLTVEGTGALIQYDGYKVSYDGNGDGVINKGEYVRLDVSLKNSGTSNAYGVKAVFSTESVYVSDF